MACSRDCCTMLRYQSWEKAKSKYQHYRARRPELSALYRVVYDKRYELERVWSDRFQPMYGVLRDVALSALDEYLNCGLLCHGAARVYCDSCKHSLLVAFSCKRRGVCPSCGAKRAVKFAEHLYTEVIDTTAPQRHVVFTIPKRLRVFFRYDRGLNTLLFRAGWGSINEVLGTAVGIPAAVLTVQTAGDALKFHPHLHGCLADGVFSPSGEFTQFITINQERLTRRFAERLLSALRKADLITDSVVTQILSQQHSGFSVWLGEPFTRVGLAVSARRSLRSRTRKLRRIRFLSHVARRPPRGLSALNEYMK